MWARFLPIAYVLSIPLLACGVEVSQTPDPGVNQNDAGGMNTQGDFVPCVVPCNVRPTFFAQGEAQNLWEGTERLTIEPNADSHFVVWTDASGPSVESFSDVTDPMYLKAGKGTGTPVSWPVTLGTVGGEPAVRMIADRVEIAEGATIFVFGELPFVVAAKGRLTVRGTIDAGAKRDVPGGGGGTFGAGADCPAANQSGGGGGNGTDGAQSSDGQPGGKGSPALPRLVGGGRGGHGCDGAGNPGRVGGAGGGALMLTSATQVSVYGVVNAGGGRGTTGGNGGGGGGGAGGSIFIEAPLVNIEGQIGASGGSGAGTSGSNGNDGYPGGTAVAGSPNGGYGSDKDGEPTSGTGGGGGGGAGRVRIRTEPDGLRIEPRSLFNPRAETAAVVFTDDLQTE